MGNTPIHSKRDPDATSHKGHETSAGCMSHVLPAAFLARGQLNTTRLPTNQINQVIVPKKPTVNAVA